MRSDVVVDKHKEVRFEPSGRIFLEPMYLQFVVNYVKLLPFTLKRPFFEDIVN